MDPQTVFCPNSTCYARGHIGKGNIRVHSREKRRYVCGLMKVDQASAHDWFHFCSTPP